MASVGQRGALVVTSGPATNPVTTAEQKLWAHVNNSVEDTLIESLIKAYTKDIEDKWQNRALVTQTLTWTLDSFGDALDCRGAMIIPKPPLQSVTSIKYVNTDGDTKTWDPDDYTVDIATEPGRVTPAFGESYPSTRNVINAVTVIFVAGYGNASKVPDTTKNAIKVLVAIELARGDETDARKIEQMRIQAENLIHAEALESPG